MLGWRLASIVANGDGTITLTFNTPSGPAHVTFDQVILALPFSVLRGLDYSQAGFDLLKITAITQLGYGTNSKLHLQFDNRYWNGQGPWGIRDGFIFTDLPFQRSWVASRAQPSVDGLLVDYKGGSQGASYHPPTPYSTSKSSPLVDQFARQCLAQLEGPWPGITPHYTGLATLSYPTGDPNKLGSYSAWKVGNTPYSAGMTGLRKVISISRVNIVRSISRDIWKAERGREFARRRKCLANLPMASIRTLCRHARARRP